MSVSHMKKKVVELTLSGFSDAEIAEELKVTPGYISQIKSDVSWQALYQEMVAAQGVSKFQTYSAIDNNWDSLEKMFTDALVENATEVVAAMAGKPGLLISFGKLLNGAKRRASGEVAPVAARNQSAVPLELPAFIVAAAKNELPAVVHNEKQEILEIGGRTLVAMGSDSLRELVTKKEQEAALPKNTYIKEERPSLPVTGGNFEFAIEVIPAAV